MPSEGGTIVFELSTSCEMPIIRGYTAKSRDQTMSAPAERMHVSQSAAVWCYKNDVYGDADLSVSTGDSTSPQ